MQISQKKIENIEYRKYCEFSENSKSIENNWNFIYIYKKLEDVIDEAIKTTIEIEQKLESNDIDSLKKENVVLTVIEEYWNLLVDENNQIFSINPMEKITIFRILSLINLYYINWRLEYLNSIELNIEPPFLIKAKPLIAFLLRFFIKEDINLMKKEEIVSLKEYLIGNLDHYYLFMERYNYQSIERTLCLNLMDTLSTLIFDGVIIIKLNEKYSHFKYLQFNREKRKIVKVFRENRKLDYNSNEKQILKKTSKDHLLKITLENNELLIKLFQRIEILIEKIVNNHERSYEVRNAALEYLSSLNKQKTEKICFDLIEYGSESEIKHFSIIKILNKIKPYEHFYRILNYILSPNENIWQIAVEFLDILIDEDAKKVEVVDIHDNTSRSFYFFALEQLLEFCMINSLNIDNEIDHVEDKKKDILFRLFLEKDLIGLLSITKVDFYSTLKTMILNQKQWNLDIIINIAERSENKELKTIAEEILIQIYKKMGIDNSSNSNNSRENRFNFIL